MRAVTEQRRARKVDDLLAAVAVGDVTQAQFDRYDTSRSPA
jgi:hypothetical protein